MANSIAATGDTDAPDAHTPASDQGEQPGTHEPQDTLSTANDASPAAATRLSGFIGPDTWMVGKYEP